MGNPYKLAGLDPMDVVSTRGGDGALFPMTPLMARVESREQPEMLKKGTFDLK